MSIMTRNMSVLSIAVAAVITLSLLPSCSDVPEGVMPITTSSDRARKAYLIGRDYAENLRGYDARTHLEKAVELDPDFALAYLLLADSERAAAAALASLRQAAGLSDRVSEGERLFIESRLAAAEGRRDDQRAALIKLVELYPNDVRAHTELGNFYFASAILDSALLQYDKAIEIDPEYPPPHNQRGYTLRYMGRLDEAEASLERYIELIPNDPNPYDSYAELQLRRGQYEESIAAYRKALEQSSRFNASYLGIATNYNYQGKYLEARETLQKSFTQALNDGQRRAALLATAISFVDEGNFEGAIQELHDRYDLAVRANDTINMATDLSLIANVYFFAQQIDSAESAIKRSYSLMSSEQVPEAYRRIIERRNYLVNAYLSIARGEYQRADTLIGEFERLRAEAGMIDSDAANTMRGILEYSQGNYKDALAGFEDGPDRDPINLYYKGLTLEALGEKEKALETLTYLLDLRPVNNLGYSWVRHMAARALAELSGATSTS